MSRLGFSERRGEGGEAGGRKLQGRCRGCIGWQGEKLEFPAASSSGLG